MAGSDLLMPSAPEAVDVFFDLTTTARNSFVDRSGLYVNSDEVVGRLEQIKPYYELGCLASWQAEIVEDIAEEYKVKI